MYFIYKVDACDLNKYSIYVQSELVHRNLVSHLQDGMNHHLRLAVQRIMEQQTVIVAVNKRLTTLETQVANSTTKIGVVQTTTAASVAAVALATKHLSDKVDEDMSTMEKRHKNELQALQKAQTQINAHVTGIDQRVTRMTTVSSSATTAESK